ncbi:hypothetical protein D3C87_704210 [compost metagenome]
MIVSMTIAFASKTALSYLFQPTVPTAIFKVLQIVLVVVCFFFKNDVPVGQMVVPVFHQVYEIVEQVADIKRQNK